MTDSANVVNEFEAVDGKVLVWVGNSVIDIVEDHTNDVYFKHEDFHKLRFN